MYLFTGAVCEESFQQDQRGWLSVCFWTSGWPRPKEDNLQTYDRTNERASFRYFSKYV